MRRLERLGKMAVVLTAFLVSGLLAHQFGAGGLWRGFDTALALTKSSARKNYDLSRLEAVKETLKYIRKRYVEPDRIKPREMLLSALNNIQRDVAQVIVLRRDEQTVTVRVDTHEKDFQVGDVLGPWDVATKLREIFAFLQQHLRGTEVDLRNVEYAACNGILHTLDPHSSFLSPEAYKEMNLSTSGHFGGLGIVISIRDQLLTVIRPMPQTPAGRAGIKRHDRVMKINNESTLNMPLDDAVRRLRGKAGTKVTVWIARKGAWKGTRRFVLSRERIKVASVVSRRLDGSIGYVRLKQFQATSTAEIREALDRMRAQGPLKGLVLDLRGNPGGLLDQAARVSDLFIKRGVLVSTVGASEGREEKKASSRGTEPPYPLVVLVSPFSASASEIVAGALKNHQRAVVVGQTTFGKGSVQLVFPEVTRDKAALKLTIAQYLTPGDISIQGVGVTPHVELDPMTVDRLEMDLTVQQSGVRERDLSQALSNSHAARPSKPGQVLRYYLSEEERQAKRERGGEISEDFTLDFPIQFARRLAQQLPAGRNAEAQLNAVGSFIEQARAQEVKKVSAELAALGIDWAAAKANKPTAGPSKSDFEVTVKTDPPEGKAVAGGKISIKVTVKNNSAEPVYRLRATTQSDNAYFNEKELVFGRIDAGESKTAEAPLSWCKIDGRLAGSTKPTPKDAKRICKLPMDAHSRSDGVKIHFDAAGGFAPPSAEVRPSIEALPRPLFQYSYQVSDDVEGNGDGLIQRGERISVYLKVKNVGIGRSFRTQANLANRSGDGVLLRKGRFDISNMMPGDVRTVTFSFDVQKQLRENEVVLGLSVSDRDLRESVTEKVKLPVVPAAPLASASGTVTSSTELMLFPDARGRGEPFGKLAANTALKLLARDAKIAKIALSDDRFAFVLQASLKPGGTPKTDLSFETIYAHAPPTLNVKAAAMATTKDHVKISVEAFDSERLLDLYMFVGSRKLYYKSNRNGASKEKASFEYDTPLQPGVNLITVVARESPDTTTRRVVVVRRDGPDGSILKTPKHQNSRLFGIAAP